MCTIPRQEGNMFRSIIDISSTRHAKSLIFYSEISFTASLYSNFHFRFKTEAEVFKWSFVFESFIPDEILKDIKNSVQG